MTLQEIRDKKMELEHELYAAIKKFQKQTGICVIDVQCSWNGYNTISQVSVTLERL